MRAILITALLAPLAVAQQSDAPAAVKRPATFEATTQLVIVNVAAKTKSGEPIDGLKASDFTVIEDGKPQQVKIFEFERLEDALLPAPALVRREEEEVTAVKPLVGAAIAPAKPGEIKYRDRRLLVLFFDQAGMPVADQLRAQQSALKYLNTEITKSDLARISHRICRASHGGGGRRQITNRIGDGEVPDGENSLCGDHIAADLVGILSLLGQTS